MFRNTSVEWFDWGDNEPNNFGGQVGGHILSFLAVVWFGVGNKGCAIVRLRTEDMIYC